MGRRLSAAGHEPQEFGEIFFCPQKTRPLRKPERPLGAALAQIAVRSPSFLIIELKEIQRLTDFFRRGVQGKTGICESSPPNCVSGWRSAIAVSIS